MIWKIGIANRIIDHTNIRYNVANHNPRAFQLLGLIAPTPSIQYLHMVHKSRNDNHNSIVNISHNGFFVYLIISTTCRQMQDEEMKTSSVTVDANRVYDPEEELDVSKLDSLRLFVESVVLGEYSGEEAFSSTKLIAWRTDDARCREASEWSPFSAMELVKKNVFFTLAPKVDISAFNNFR